MLNDYEYINDYEGKVLLIRTGRLAFSSFFLDLNTPKAENL